MLADLVCLVERNIFNSLVKHRSCVDIEHHQEPVQGRILGRLAQLTSGTNLKEPCSSKQCTQQQAALTVVGID